MYAHPAVNYGGFTTKINRLKEDRNSPVKKGLIKRLIFFDI